METSTPYSTDEIRWQALCHRDKSADGYFYYGVTTTGVYCRPGCSSRLPKRSNVRFFASCDDAEKAGFRSCKRCNPGADSSESEVEHKIIQACRRIEESESHIKLDELAAGVGLSPHHFHRLFKKMVGVTPKQYSANHTSKRFRESLQTSPSVTDAIYSAGYSSSSSAYDKKQDRLAMQPKTYRNGGQGITIIYSIAECFLGWLIVAATDRGICAIEFADEPESLPAMVQKRFPKAHLEKADSGFETRIQEVVEYINTPGKGFNLPLDIQGTAFQQQVWNVLRQIQAGETLSYTDVAERIERPSAVRAVASAVASNKLGVVIPCHRVISKGGKVSGYRWGVERKKRLLEAEKATGSQD